MVQIILKVKNIINKNKSLLESFNNIKTIKGFGDVSAIVLIHLFIKYPDVNQRQVVSLSGLEPISKTSGTSVNPKPIISKQG